MTHAYMSVYSKFIVHYIVLPGAGILNYYIVLWSFAPNSFSYCYNIFLVINEVISYYFSSSVTGTMLVCFPGKSSLIILFFIMELLLLLLEAICLVSNILSVKNCQRREEDYSLAFLLYQPFISASYK